jgi:hypothetical protein
MQAKYSSLAPDPAFPVTAGRRADVLSNNNDFELG